MWARTLVLVIYIYMVAAPFRMRKFIVPYKFVPALFQGANSYHSGIFPINKNLSTTYKNKKIRFYKTNEYNTTYKRRYRNSV